MPYGKILVDQIESSAGEQVNTYEITDILKSIALALNVPREAVLNGVAGQVITAEKEYLHNPDDQATWELPAGVGAGEVIVSVVGDQLETDVSSPSAYTLISIVDNYNKLRSANKKQSHTLLYRDSAGDDGGGLFVFDDSDLSGFVTADLLSGLYVAPSDDLTGASGAWVRQWDGWNIRPDWFGDQQNAVLYATNALIALGGNVLLLNKRYKPSDMTSPIQAANISIIGAKKPWFSTNCDRLEGGSIIEGAFRISADNFSHTNVGYDNGEFVRQTYFPTFTGDTNDYPLGGGTWDAFALAQIDVGSPVQRNGYNAKNIIGLCIKSSTVGHALLQESFSDGHMENMHGMYSLHPFVIKGDVVRGGNLNGYAGGDEHFNLKADDYAACNDIDLTSVSTDLQPQNTTPHSAPNVPNYGVFTYSSTANVTDVKLGVVKAWGAVNGVGESGGTVDNFIDGFHIEHLNINGRNYPGASGLFPISDIKHYNYTFGTVKISNVTDACAYKNQATGGGYENAAMKIGTLIVANASLRGLNAVGHGQIIVDTYITRGTVVNKYACDDTARLRIGSSRDEGTVTNRFYNDPITLSAGNWQQYTANAAFGIDLKNYGVIVTGLLQQLSNVNAVICNLPAYLRPAAPTRLPIVIRGTVGGIQTQFATPAPANANLVVNDAVNMATTDADTWLSLDGLRWGFD